MHIFESLATLRRVAYISKIQQNTFFVSLTLLLPCCTASKQNCASKKQQGASEKICISKRKFSFASNIKKMCIFFRKATLKVGLELAIFVIFIHDIIPSPCLLKLFIQFDTFQYILMHFNFRIMNETFL